MKTKDLLQFSVSNLRRRKGRTFSTIVGVVVGVCSIILMLSFGIAVNISTSEMLETWGDLKTITVSSNSQDSNAPVLDNNFVSFLNNMPGVSGASPIENLQANGYIEPSKGGKYQMEASSIVGMAPGSISKFGYELISGDFALDKNSSSGVIPILVSEITVFNFHNSKKAWSSPTYMVSPEYDEDGIVVNKQDAFFEIENTELLLKLVVDTDSNGKVTLQTYKLKIVGIIKVDSKMPEHNFSGGIVMSISNLEKIEKRFNAKNSAHSGLSSRRSGYSSVLVKVDEINNVSTVEAAIKDIGYQTYSMNQIREEMLNQVLRSQMMLGGLAAISLFVAALNIANTMTMSTVERTKEIGIIKVLGCSLSDIRAVFLIESGLIGFLGGVVGVLLSCFISFIVNHMGNVLLLLGFESELDFGSIFGLGSMGNTGARISIIPWWLMVTALLFATIVGLMSGIKPANRAMKISSLEAIRRE